MRALAVALTAGLAAAQTPDPPDPSKLLKTYTIDLDQPPEQRWTKVAQDYTTFIKETRPRRRTPLMFNKNTVSALVSAMKTGHQARSADELGGELQGIANVTGIPFDDILMLNGFYEISRTKGSGAEDVTRRMCTSIVAQNSNGSSYLGHNFDYPTIFGPGMINMQFTKGGKNLFIGTGVAGTIGIVAGVVPGKFAASIDARDAHTPSLADAVKAAESGAFGFLGIARKAMEVATTYADAVQFYKTTPMISPGYLIVGGAAPGEGAVVTTNSSAVGNDVWPLKEAGGWYLVETNYDHWNPAPSSDDRRDPAIKRIEAIGKDGISMRGMWNVISSAPNFRTATISSHLVDIGTGEYRTYLRHSI